VNAYGIPFYVLYVSISLYFLISSPNYICLRMKIMNLLIVRFFYIPHYLVPHRPKYSPYPVLVHYLSLLFAQGELLRGHKRGEHVIIDVEFEVLTAVVTKSSIFCDISRVVR
jgi:hypothetical protein